MKNTYIYTNPFLRRAAYIIDGAGRLLFFWIRRNASIPAEKIRKILIVRFDQLGDAFYFLPAIEYLEAKFPEAHIDVVCTERNAAIFEHHPYMRRIIRFNYPRFMRMRTEKGPTQRATFLGAARLALRLRREKYDLMIDPRGEPFVSALGFFAGIPYRIGLGEEEVLSFLYTHPVRYDPRAFGYTRFQSMLALLGIEVKEWRAKLYPTAEEKERVERLIRERLKKPFLAFHISAGYHFKMWPLEHFASLIEMLAKNGVYQFALLGSADDKYSAEEVLGRAHADGIEDFTGIFNIRETYWFLSHAKGFVGNDSVLVHFAASFDIPAVQLMNAAVPLSATALGKKAVLIGGRDPAHQCGHRRCAYPCPNMMRITPAEVYTKFTELL